MKTIGFPISKKENERRIALVPNDFNKIKNLKYLCFEKGYGEALGYSDLDYVEKGVNIGDRKEVLKSDIICDAKIGDEEYIATLKENQVVFGWVHAVQNKSIRESIIKNKLTAIAWEDMFEGKRHCFWRNNEIAGETAILHSYMYHGDSPKNTKVAILGKGNVAMGAYKILCKLGAEVSLYSRTMEDLFKKEFYNYDVIVNAILWDTKRKDHIIYKKDLKNMKRNSMIVDISCDRNGAIETSVPTTINNPVYKVHNVLHYVVDHTPTLLFKDASKEISKVVSKFIDYLVEEKESIILKNATIIEKGKILDRKMF